MDRRHLLKLSKAVPKEFRDIISWLKYGHPTETNRSIHWRSVWPVSKGLQSLQYEYLSNSVSVSHPHSRCLSLSLPSPHALVNVKLQLPNKCWNSIRTVKFIDYHVVWKLLVAAHLMGNVWIPVAPWLPRTAKAPSPISLVSLSESFRDSEPVQTTISIQSLLYKL